MAKRVFSMKIAAWVRRGAGRKRMSMKTMGAALQTDLRPDYAANSMPMRMVCARSMHGLALLDANAGACAYRKVRTLHCMAFCTMSCALHDVAACAAIVLERDADT